MEKKNIIFAKKSIAEIIIKIGSIILFISAWME